MKKRCLAIIIIILVTWEATLLAGIGQAKDPHTRKVLCNSCHGKRNDAGYPDTGKHSFHIDRLNYDLQNSEKFKNNSYEDDSLEDPNPIDDIRIYGENTSWDLCDECHHTSTPYTYQKRKQECDLCHTVGPILPSFTEPDNVVHINGETKVSFMDSTATYDELTKSCSGLSSCHSTTSVDNVQWGREGKKPKQIKEEFFREYCSECHVNISELETQKREDIFLPRTIERTCNQCHGEDEDVAIEVRHPVNVEVSDELKMGISSVFSFEDDYTMTCVTCHDPHGEICQSCHSLNDQEINADKGKDLEKVFGGKLYDPVDRGSRESRKNTIPARRGNVYLRTVEEYDFDYYSHSFEYSELRQLKESFCVACHDMTTPSIKKGMNIHQNYQCGDCHNEMPYNKRICYKKAEEPDDFYPMVDIDKNVRILGDVNVRCGTCHTKRHFHVPETQVIISEKLPSDLALSPWKELNCTTCHDPHLKYGDTGLIFRRASGEGKGLCESCHAEQEKFLKINPHNQKKRCFYCHLTEPYQQGWLKYDDEVLLQRAYISRCEICHADWKNGHPINVPPYRNNELGLPLNRQEMISCGSCHDHHDPDELIIPQFNESGSTKKLCAECHKD